MLAKGKRSWQELKRSRPGKRFQQRYERRHEEAGGRPARRILTVLVGGAIFAAGLFFLPAPGPGTVILALGAGILAQESLAMAKALDWAELQIRGVVEWWLGIWRRASPVQRAGMIALKVAFGAGVAWLTWRVAFGG